MKVGSDRDSMARSSSAKSKARAAVPKWKTKWPRNGDLRLWFLCMIEKCDAFENPVEGASKAHLPIEHLAEIGHADEALRHVNRFLRKQPCDDSFEIVRMSELGAKICLDRDDLVRMEKHLARAAAAPVHRKCDFGWPEKSVRQFRAHNGILDPVEAVDEDQWIEATFRRGQRRFRHAMNEQYRTDALAALKEMQNAAMRIDGKSFRHWAYHRILLNALAEVGDATGVKRLFRRFNRNTGDLLLDYGTLWTVGLKTEAIAQAMAEVQKQLNKLATMKDPNIHFPTRAICDALSFLADHGKQNVAKRMLKKVIAEMPTWPVYQLGWTTAAVYRMLAEMSAKLNDPDAATLLALAHQDAKSEKNPGWRKGAIRSVMTAEATMGTLDNAIASARKLRSPTERRLQLCKLLARARRWKELADVCSEAASPIEAAELCWTVKFELPGGEVK